MNWHSANGWPHLDEIVAPALAFLKIKSGGVFQRAVIVLNKTPVFILVSDYSVLLAVTNAAAP